MAGADDLNEKRDLARDIIEETGMSLFLTGKAGTGKTTFLKELRENSRKQLVVTAPTGIAAINAGGVTLHSFFQLDFAPYVPETREMRRQNGYKQRFSKEKIRMIRGMDVLVIDEISMVRADVLDAVDAVMRRFRDRTRPFGGVQLLMIGDLQQLPPVVVESERRILEKHYRSPYFFDSEALRQLPYETIELDKVYRQATGRFLDILNAIRDDKAGSDVLAELNARCRSNFNPADEEGYIRLTTHNHLANVINEQRMAELPTKPYTFSASVKGTFPESSYPVEKELTLKLGAQVMFIKNDTGEDRRFFNGMIGHVTALDNEMVEVTPINGDGPILVPQMEWENMKYTIDEENGEIKEEREGAFKQFPLKNAWAITIHKSQGLTFDRAIIDAAASFSHGQTYVALSRCRTLEGLVLEKPITPRAIICDSTVSDYMREQVRNPLDTERVSRLKEEYFAQMLGELFDFRQLSAAFEGTVRLIQENFSHIYPALISKLLEKRDELKRNIVDVAAKYARQLERIMAEGGNDPAYAPLLKRVKEGAAFYGKVINELSELVEEMPREHDNKNVRSKLVERLEFLEDIVRLKRDLFAEFEKEDFELSRYLDAKSKSILNGESLRRSKKVKLTIGEQKSEYSDDNLHPEFFDRLMKWRREKAGERPVYSVLSTKSLLAVSNYLPMDEFDLLSIPGIGKAKVAEYGDELLRMTRQFMASAESITVLPLPVKKGRKKH